MRIGIIGSGSWATALAKIVTDNGHTVHWWIRNEETIQYFKKRRHNPHYLSSVYFDLSQIKFYWQYQLHLFIVCWGSFRLIFSGIKKLFQP